MTAQLSVRRMLAVGAIAAAAAFAAFSLCPATSQATSIPFVDGNGVTRAQSRVGVYCNGRYVQYRADTFRTDDQFWFQGTLTVWFRMAYDRWTGSVWQNMGEVIGWTPATGGGQFTVPVPAGTGYFRLRTQFAWTIGYGFSYSGWSVETFNGNGLDFCRY